MSFLGEAAIFLIAAVLAVPVSKRLGLGSIIGYLAAGVLIGPFGFGFIAEPENVLHFAEFGVVLLLFIIGLELQPSRLWVMRRAILGAGGGQMAATTLALGALGLVFGLALQEAIIVGLALALSSTAFALQILAERGEMTTRQGRTGFAILLFQDMAVIPILALIPFLTTGLEPVDEIADPAKIVQGLGALFVVIVGGRFIVGAAYSAVAAADVPEVLTALALLIVIGTALLMDSVGLSMGLGAFLAGVLLAESEFRHQVETDIEPFKALLLGLFFIAVGMSANLDTALEAPMIVIGIAVGLMVLKGMILAGLGWWFGLGRHGTRTLAIGLSQGGEFAFVIFTVAIAQGALRAHVADILVVSVTISMALTPLAFLLLDLYEDSRTHETSEDAEEDIEALEEEAPQVIIAGFGRVGQIVGRILKARGIPFVGLEKDPRQVKLVASFGNKSYYGDASRVDLLRAAGADKAAVFVLAVGNMEASLKIAETVRHAFPKLEIYARAINREHAYRLMDLGVRLIERETFRGSLHLARRVLTGLGLPDRAAELTVDTFRQHDEHLLASHYEIKDDFEKRRLLTRKAADELAELIQKDIAGKDR
ncbi:MAG: monovalent cation:proton antiporter-2 (CPA2) family protein [Alphaproteobacteria bacterium]|nr:monovalent cation:proton antiporter-2 (CPA2) family protein [Alphaproteobacteria bacterium]MDX5370480.1 monovalent cation:proton antiporter-2 (CPA2) family protein [Alphaproteobacteria bacterium]MDX5464986.1 monovalent cation:proton antiporter-2 (CPA2) family protein [Alphaproteobacteria bacterium]